MAIIIGSGNRVWLSYACPACEKRKAFTIYKNLEIGHVVRLCDYCTIHHVIEITRITSGKFRMRIMKLTMTDAVIVEEILKPCFFCSNVEEVTSGQAVNGYCYIGCGACGARGPLEETMDTAIEKWNGIERAVQNE